MRGGAALLWKLSEGAIPQDPERAAEVIELSREGYARHGRGCVFVRSSLTGRFGQVAASRKAKMSRHMAALVQASSSRGAPVL